MTQRAQERRQPALKIFSPIRIQGRTSTTKASYESLGSSEGNPPGKKNCQSSARLQTRSEPEGDKGGERNGGEEVGCELVVTGGDAAEVLDPAEGVFDAVALPVAGLVVYDLALAVGAAGDDGHSPGLAQGPAQGVSVVSLVGQYVSSSLGAGQQRRGDGDVGDVARGEDQGEGASDGVSEGVDLGSLAAARGADRLRFRPPFAPKAERCALT
jgi:hypothetical protein